MNADVGILGVAPARGGAPAPAFGLRDGRRGRVSVVEEGRGFAECLAGLEALVSELGRRTLPDCPTGNFCRVRRRWPSSPLA